MFTLHRGRFTNLAIAFAIAIVAAFAIFFSLARNSHAASSFDNFSNTHDQMITDTIGSNMYGNKLASGDFNCDGYQDLAVSDPMYDYNGTDAGVVLVYAGSSSGLASTYTWLLADSSGSTKYQFGESLASADINGDGCTDVVVGSRYYNTYGRFYIFHGSTSGLSTTPNLKVTGTSTDSGAGSSVGNAGDVNNDGYNDILVTFFGPRKVKLFLGSASGLNTTPVWTNNETSVSYNYGHRVGSVGDVNNDGYDDFMVTAPSYISGGEYIGKAYIYSGGTTLSTTPMWQAVGSVYHYQSTNFGTSFSRLGDVNGDGIDDFAVGQSPPCSLPCSFVSVWYGSTSTISSTPDWNEALSYYGAGNQLGTGGDVNYDGYNDMPFAISTGGGGFPALIAGSANGLEDGIAWSAAVYGYANPELADYDGDLLLDLAGSAYGKVYVHYNSADEPVTGLSVELPDPLTLNTQLNFTATVATGENVNYSWDLIKHPRQIQGTGNVLTATLTDAYTLTVNAYNETNVLTSTQIITIP